MALFYKKFVIFIVIIVFVLLASLYYMSSSPLSGIPVLNYHQINDEAHNVLTLSSYEFDAQMAYLHKAGYNTISSEQLIDFLQNGKSLPPNPIMITFDDGYEDNYRVAYPILQKYNLSATIFLITDFVGHNGRYLTWKQVKEMHEHGMNFESHTLSHVELPRASDEDLYNQLAKSKEVIESRLNQKVNCLAYPGGAYDRRVIQLAKEAGYQAAFTIKLGRDKKKCALFTLNRIPIFAGSHTFLRFWLRLKFTEALIAMQDAKDRLHQLGATRIADCIYIP